MCVCIHVTSITDLNERAALEQQIMEFGQTPKQLFTKPHVARPNQMDIAVKNHKFFNSHTPPSLSIESKECDATEKGGTMDKGVNDVPDIWGKVGDLKVQYSYELHKAGVTGVRWSEDASVIYSIDQGIILLLHLHSVKYIHVLQDSKRYLTHPNCTSTA